MDLRLPVRPHGLHTLVSQLVKKSGREASQELHIALSQRIVAKHLHMPGISIEATADEIRHLAEKAERKAESVGDRVADASSAGTRDKADHRAAGRAHEEVASLSKPTKVRLSWITRPVWRTA